MISTAAFVVSIVFSTAAAMPLRSSDQSGGTIQIYHDRPPLDVVKTFEATCDGTYYSVAIRPEAGRLADRLHALRVGGIDVSPLATADILSRLTDTTMIIDAGITDCGLPGSSRARFRLITVDRPWRGSPNRSIYFWLSTAGEVSDITVN